MIDYKTKPKKMDSWWQTDLGQCLLGEELELLQSLANHFYGYYQLQIGATKQLLPSNAKPCKQIVLATMADVDGEIESLPFKCHSIDTVLSVHGLTFASDPHQVLREAERVLVADGTLVLCCFNPWSLWGLRHLFSWQDQPPWFGKFIRLAKIKDWLSLLNFEIITVKPAMFRPPISSIKWLNSLSGMERWGKRLWPFFAGVHIIVARKRTIPLTPIRQRWRPVQLFPTGKVTAGVTRERLDG